jgi:hypothetical protein
LSKYPAGIQFTCRMLQDLFVVQFMFGKKQYIVIFVLLLLTGFGSGIPGQGLGYSKTFPQEGFNLSGPADAFPNQKKYVISFGVTLYSASMIAIELQGLEGSNPQASGYYMAIWQGNQIEDLYRNQGQQLINLDTQDGSFVFQPDEGINNKDYIIGLGIDYKDSTSFCSTMIIPKGQDRYVPVSDTFAFSSSVTVVQLGTNSLIAAYSTPDFNLPEMNDNWIALFRGRFTANNFKGINLIKKQNIKNNLNEGMAAISNIEGGLVPNQYYTVVYGMGYGTADSSSTKNIIAATEFLVPGK